MNKATLALLALMALPVSALEYEVGVGINQLEVTWIDDALFYPTTYMAEGSVWKDNIGLKVQVGRSEWGDNVNNGTPFDDSAAKMKSFYTITAMYKIAINDAWDFQFGRGHVAYDQAVTNAYGDGYSNTDADWFWTGGLTYEFSKDTRFNVFYSDYYEKDKGSHGVEETKGLSFTISKRF